MIIHIYRHLHSNKSEGNGSGGNEDTSGGVGGRGGGVAGQCRGVGGYHVLPDEDKFAEGRVSLDGILARCMIASSNKLQSK